MSSSYSFAHHKSFYQFFFFSFYFHCFPAFLSLLTSPPTFLLSSSPFSLLLSFPLFSSSFQQSYLLPPFRRSLPPPRPHLTTLFFPSLLSTTLFYLTSFSNPFPSGYPLTHPPLSFPGPYISFASLLPIIPYSLSKLLPRGFNCRNNLLRYSFIFLSGEQLCRVRPHSLNLDHSLCVQNRGLRLHLLVHLNVPQYLSQGQLQGHQR